MNQTQISVKDFHNYRYERWEQNEVLSPKSYSYFLCLWKTTLEDSS